MVIPSYNLISIVKTLRKNQRLILIITLCCMVLGGIAFFIKKPKYKSTAVFLVSSPLYGDRNTLFRNQETRYVDYFGGDDDIDRVLALLNSDTVRQRIIRDCQFDVIYRSDLTAGKGNEFLMNVLKKNLDIKRSEYKEIAITYTAYDSTTAANVANTTVKILEETFRWYYASTKAKMNIALKAKIADLDSSINLLTDSLTNMRDRYGIYSIISPVRETATPADLKGSGKGFARAIEEIQNVESIKDQLVMDRAKYISATNEFAASSNAEMDYVKVISRALPMSKPAGPDLIIVIIACAFIGFFFTTVFILIRDYYALLRNSINDAINAQQ
ncbi:MAG: hypothetical protein EBZ77_05065 [Chitinophagia bacterium]|nr:hypothetical protein [Chitinophagia bacterium]